MKSYSELFGGYEKDARRILSRTFDEVEGYQDFILLKDIPFYSHCEHHLAPIQGTVSIAYIPNYAVVGISKLARLVDMYARRLQIQERMTQQIAQSLSDVLQPRGVAVFIEAAHGCMSARGVRIHGSIMKTSYLHGLFKSDSTIRERLFHALR